MKKREVVKLRRSQRELWDEVTAKIRQHETIINKAFGMLASDLLGHVRRTLAQEAEIDEAEYVFDPAKKEFRLKKATRPKGTAP